MHWYIQKVSAISLARSVMLTLSQGDPVKEDTPVKFDYFMTTLVASGIPADIGLPVSVCEDPGGEGAPIYRVSGM